MRTSFFKYAILFIYFYFTYLLLLITIQYIPMRFDVAFLRIKYEEIRLLHYKIAFFVHVYTSIFLVLLGWAQFLENIRRKQKDIHQLIGKIYIFLIVFLSGPSGLVMSYYANGGVIAQTSFVILSVLWMYFTYRSYAFIRKGDFINHQKFAIRSFALTLSAISLRLFKYIIVFLFHPPPMDVYRIVSWLGWGVNLIIAEIIIFKLFIKSTKNGIKTK